MTHTATRRPYRPRKPSLTISLRDPASTYDLVLDAVDGRYHIAISAASGPYTREANAAARARYGRALDYLVTVGDLTGRDVREVEAFLESDEVRALARRVVKDTAIHYRTTSEGWKVIAACDFGADALEAIGLLRAAVDTVLSPPA